MRTTISCACIGSGLIMIVMSARTGGWTSILLLNLGTSVLLIVPILAVSLRLEREIEAAEKRTKQETAAIRKKVDAVEADSRRSLEEIRSAFLAMQAARQSSELALIDDLIEAPGYGSMKKALDFYTSSGAISETGIRFRLGYPDIWVQLRPTASQIEARIQRKDGEHLSDCIWHEGTTPEQFFDAIAAQLSSSGNYVPDGLDPAQLFLESKALLFTARATRLERAGDDLGPVRQICPLNG